MSDGGKKRGVAYVVEAAGQPLPGPNRFCRDEMEVCSRVICEAFELSVGKGAAIS
jgi:hypothetical protein